MIKDLIEDRAKEVENLENRMTLRRILGNLFERAKVGNRASEELEDKWGFCPNQDWRDMADSNWS